MNVLVCDDHPIVAAAIAMMIETAFDATVHIASTYRQAGLIAIEHPDIQLCLLDVHIGAEDTRAGIRNLQSVLSHAKFLLFSGSEQDADLMITLDLGLHGFLPKSSTPPVVEAALRLVLAGGTYLPSGIGHLAMRKAGPADHACAAPSPVKDVPSRDLLYGSLTDRQHVVLQHVAMGQSNKEIARDLVISPATVKAHVAHIIAVLGAANRTEAAARARGLGLIDAG